MADHVGEALDFLVRLGQVRGAPLNAPFEIGVQGGDLGPRPRQLARVPRRDQRRAADDQDDEDGAQRDRPEQRRDGIVLRVRAVLDPIVDLRQETRQGGARQVHRPLAAVGSNDVQGGTRLAALDEVDGLRQLGRLVGHRRLELVDLGPGADADALEMRDALGQRPVGLEIGLQIVVPSREQVAALAGLHVLERAAGLDEGVAGRAGLRDLGGIVAGEHGEPGRHRDDRQQNDEAAELERQDGADERAAGDGHRCGLGVPSRAIAGEAPSVPETVRLRTFRAPAAIEPAARVTLP